MTSRWPCWRSKQRDGGHLGGVKYSFGDRPFATNDHMVHGGEQADYYSRTGTLKERDLNQ